MADIHQIISLGIGSPADIEHFILVGLSATGEITLVAGASATIRVPPDDPTLEVYRVWDAATIRVLGDDPTFTIED